MMITPCFLADSCYLRIPKQLLDYFEEVSGAKVTVKSRFKMDIEVNKEKRVLIFSYSTPVDKLFVDNVPADNKQNKPVAIT